MKIMYKHDGDLTIGIMTFDDNFEYVKGYDNYFVDSIAKLCSSTEHKQLLNMAPLRSFAKPVDDDTYDEKTGEVIVRNKLYIKFAERQALKLSIMEKYCNKIIKKISDDSRFSAEMMDDSYKQLEKFENA